MSTLLWRTREELEELDSYELRNIARKEAEFLSTRKNSQFDIAVARLLDELADRVYIP